MRMGDFCNISTVIMVDTHGWCWSQGAFIVKVAKCRKLSFTAIRRDSKGKLEVQLLELIPRSDLAV
jgi:hypothetical protein